MQGPGNRFHKFVAGACACLLSVIFVVACNLQSTPQTVQERYQLSDAEAEAWTRLHVDEADSAAAALWGHIGRQEYDQAKLLVDRYGDARMSKNFEGRIQNVWAPIIQWPAADFSTEPQIALGKSQTIGFRTWGELLSSGFQRAVLAEDSITVFFVLKGYWQTETIPIYAAVSCGDFGTETAQWRPFAHIIFSADASEATVNSTGQAYFAQNLDDFLAFLKKRTFGSFGS